SLSLLFLAIRPPPLFTLFPYTTLFRSPPVGIRRRPPGSWSSETTVDGYDALPWTPSFVSLMRNSRGRNRTRRTLGRPVDRFDRSPCQPRKRAAEKGPVDVPAGRAHPHQGRYNF